MKSKSEQIYEAIGEGYGYNGSKEECIKIIEDILKKKPANKNFIKPDGVTKRGSKKCAEWLAYCLETGWKKEQLDELEKIYWTWRDKNGELKMETTEK